MGRRLEAIHFPQGPVAGRFVTAADTMEAWERFLTGDDTAAIPARNFVVASWLRSQHLGINPAGRSAPLVAQGDAVLTIRRKHAELLSASASVFAQVAETFSGSRSIMLLTNNDGVVLDAVGDPRTLEEGEDIHLTPGGDWRENAVGTNGIGTALATARPAQVHGAEHFCEGIKAWTCAAAPIFEPGTGAMLGVVDISGPPSTYQRNNLSLAVASARQIEMVLAERAAAERMRLLEVCLDRISEADVAGTVAIDRAGRLVHRTGRVPALVGLGQRVPGLDGGSSVEEWAGQLPEGLRAEWFSAVKVDGRAIGAVLVVPARTRAASPGQEGAFDAILGRSPALMAVVSQARHLAGKQVPVLIEGETGVGKELFARAIHAAHDPQKPFVALNCGAVAKDLLASELFGYVRGAFTGAASEGRAGRFELPISDGALCNTLSSAQAPLGRAADDVAVRMTASDVAAGNETFRRMVGLLGMGLHHCHLPAATIIFGRACRSSVVSGKLATDFAPTRHRPAPSSAPLSAPQR